MRIIIVIFLLPLVGQANVEIIQKPKDELVHSLSGTLAHLLLDRTFRISILHGTDLHNSTLGNPRILSTSSQTNLMAFKFGNPLGSWMSFRRNVAPAAFGRPAYFREPAREMLAVHVRTNSGPRLQAMVDGKEVAADSKDVALNSDCGMDYKPLKGYLERGEFQNADDETRDLLIRLAGSGAEKRGYVYFSEVKLIPVVDLQTVDLLWTTYSDGKFGYSVQKRIWKQCQQRWEDFFNKINWFKATTGGYNMYRKWPTDFIYNKTAVQGHLPLTNANRGTTLLESILSHPAFNKTGTPKWRTAMGA